MADDPKSNQGAIIEQEKIGAVQARESPVPTRQTGKEENHPRSPLDDNNTELRRAHYGEDPKSEIKSGESMDNIRFDVNQVKTPNNPTRDERIRGSNSDNNPETGFGRHMCQ